MKHNLHLEVCRNHELRESVKKYDDLLADNLAEIHDLKSTVVIATATIDTLEAAIKVLEQ